jgi:hypothetical protein
MVINPALDIWVWVAAVALLAMLGARAWVVETGRGRLGRTPVQVKVLTGGVVAVVVALFALLAMQGGVLLVQSIITGTDPRDSLIVPNDPTPGPAGGAPAPAAPPAGAPPAGAPPAAPPAAPPGG